MVVGSDMTFPRFAPRVPMSKGQPPGLRDPFRICACLTGHVKRLNQPGQGAAHKWECCVAITPMCWISSTPKTKPANSPTSTSAWGSPTASCGLWKPMPSVNWSTPPNPVRNAKPKELIAVKTGFGSIEPSGQGKYGIKLRPPPMTTPNRVCCSWIVPMPITICIIAKPSRQPILARNNGFPLMVAAVWEALI